MLGADSETSDPQFISFLDSFISSSEEHRQHLMFKIVFIPGVPKKMYLISNGNKIYTIQCKNFVDITK